MQSIPDVVSQSLDDIDALSLPAFKKYLLKAFKGYVWWYQIHNGRLPPFASMTREKFDSFLSSHHWDPLSLFGVYIDEPKPEEPQLLDISLQDFEISALQEPFFLQQILHCVLCDRGTLQESLTYHCIHSLGDLLCMPLTEIEEMTMLSRHVRTRSQLTSKAKLSSSSRVPLFGHLANKLQAFQNYTCWYHLQHGILPDFSSVTLDDFTVFRISIFPQNSELISSHSIPGFEPKSSIESVSQASHSYGNGEPTAPLPVNGETLDVPSHCLGDGEVSSSGPDPGPDPISVADSDPVLVPDPDPVHVPASGLIPSDSVHQVQYEASLLSPSLASDLNLQHTLSQQSLTVFLHPTAHPQQESFKDLSASLPHDPDNPFSGPSDPSSPVSTSRTVPTGSTDLPELPESPEDLLFPVHQIRTAHPGFPEFSVPSDGVTLLDSSLSLSLEHPHPLVPSLDLVPSPLVPPKFPLALLHGFFPPFVLMGSLSRKYSSVGAPPLVDSSCGMPPLVCSSTDVPPLACSVHTVSPMYPGLVLPLDYSSLLVPMVSSDSVPLSGSTTPDRAAIPSDSSLEMVSFSLPSPKLLPLSPSFRHASKVVVSQLSSSISTPEVPIVTTPATEPLTDHESVSRSPASPPTPVDLFSSPSFCGDTMASSPSFSDHQAHCEDIWPFDELIADGEMDPADRMASFELSKNDELDRCHSFVREKEVLRMI